MSSERRVRGFGEVYTEWEGYNVIETKSYRRRGNKEVVWLYREAVKRSRGERKGVIFKVKKKEEELISRKR